MVKQRLLTIMVLFGLMLSPLSGSQIPHEVSAQPEDQLSQGSITFQPVGKTAYLLAQPPADQGSEIELIDPTTAFVTGLYTNGPIITAPEVGYNGADVSEVQTAIGLNSGGFPSKFPANRMADDFTFYAGRGWQVDIISFFAYHYQTYTYPPVSPFTGLYLQIWDGQPDVPGSTVIFGDMGINRMISTSWTESYRVLDTGRTDQMRPIMQIDAYVGKFLPAGTYWLEWTITGNGNPDQQPMTVPISILGETTTGNAIQTFDGGSNWQAAVNSGTQTPQGMPFYIRGVPGGRTEGYWKSITPINSIGRISPAAATVNRKIYLMGGQVLSNPVKAAMVERYDPTSNTWTTMSGSMPTPASDICVASIGTDIYVAGGANSNGDIINTLQVYHTETDTWNTITTDPLPQALLGAGCAALNGKLYVFGGQASANPTFRTTAYVYNPEATAGARWATLKPMAHPRSDLSAAVVGGKIYAIGGKNFTANDLSIVEAFDPADETWHPVTNMMFARAGGGAYGVGRSLYVCGGGWDTYIRFCEVYDTTQEYGGTWQEAPAHLLQGRRNFAYATIGPVLYAIAGSDGDYLSTAERWSYDVYLPSIMR